MGAIAFASVLVAGLLLSRSQSSPPAAAPASSAAATPATATPSTAVSASEVPGMRGAQLSGPVTVLAKPFPLPGTTGYETVVAFEAENPQDWPIVSPYRVTVRAGDKVLATTDGTDRVVLAPHQRLLMENRPEGVEGARPDSATVSFYANEAGMLELPAPAGWQVTNLAGPVCTSYVIGCDVTADLAYQGEVSQDAALNLGVSAVAVIFTRGDQVVFAGVLSAPAGGPLMPGQLVPISGSVIGDTSTASGPLQAHFGVFVIPQHV